MKKVIPVLIILILLGILGWGVYIRIAEKQAKAGKGRFGRGSRKSVAVAVEIVPVRKTTMRDIGRFSGSLYPRSRFVVAPKIAGRLEKLAVDIGDTVTSGQLIAKLDDAEHLQQLEQARAELAVANASVLEYKSALDTASREFNRVKTLFKKKMSSEEEQDGAKARHTASEAKYKVALAEVARREAAVKVAEVRLSYTSISISWEDTAKPRVVGERFVYEGEMLKTNAPIVSILDVNILIALIDVIERDYPKVMLGQQAVITTDAFPDREFTGKIVRIAPLLKETSRQARVEIEINKPEGLLKPGMFIRARIEFDRHDNATVIPLASLARRDGHRGVFIADAENMKANFVPVKLGITGDGLAEVVEPSLSGSVVTMGHHLLEDGGTIRLPETQSPGAEERKKNSGTSERGGGR